MPAPSVAEKKELWGIPIGGNSGGGDYVCCPPGNHAGTIVGIFDVGHQSEVSKERGPVELHRLVLLFELKKRRPDSKPFVLAKKYTWSMNEKSNLYKDITNVTGLKFREGDNFNPLSILGTPVMISVTNTQSGEKTYHDVASIAMFPEEMPAPEPTRTPVSWSVRSGEPFPAGLDWAPFVYGKSILDLARSSAEYLKQSAPAAAPEADSSEDPIPF